MIQAVVFDFDGLIIDTETPCYHAFNKIYQEYGVETSITDLRAVCRDFLRSVQPIYVPV